VPRLLDFNIDRFMLSSSLLAVVAQRLVRKLCNECKEEYEVTGEEFEHLHITGSGSPEEMSIDTACRPRGCSACNNTGYLGRTVVGEIMVVNDEIKELIVDGASLGRLRDAALKNGMIPLREAAIRKVKDKITSIEEINRVID
jgi:type II secretory ATPase GspE/PulE/Tfp pilus assembly ATPase PilB-like protein